MKPALRKVLLSVIFSSLPSAWTQTYNSQRLRPQSSTSPDTTIRVESVEVLVDVTVTDSHGNPVSGLNQESFQILEDGKPQKITFFEVHPLSETSVSAQSLPPEPPNVHTNFIDVPGSGVVNVFLLDALNTPVADQVFARTQIINYAKALPPSQPIAVFALTSVLRQLQPFTRDRDRLVTVLNNKVSGPQQTQLGSEGEERDEMARQLETLTRARVPSQAIEGFMHSSQDQIAGHRDQRVKMTLEAFQQLSRYLASIPGKKNLLWFSAAFPLATSAAATPSTDTRSDRRRNTANYSDELRKTANLMAANRIAVFPIDVRGIMLPRSLFGASQEVQEDTAGEHNTMDTLAKETGGRAIYNTNDLKSAIDQVIHTGSLYYTLRYEPINKTLDNRVRHIDVKLDRKDYWLAFRREYYASRLVGSADKDSYNPVDSFHAAMQKGYPESSQIILKVRVAPFPSQSENRELIAGETENSKSTTSRYGVDIAAAIASVAMQQTSDDSRHGELVIGVVAYGEHDELLNSETRQVKLAFSPGDYAHVLQNGLPFHLDLDIPHGASCIRVGVFDPLSGNVGTVEISYTPDGKLLTP